MISDFDQTHTIAFVIFTCTSFIYCTYVKEILEIYVKFQRTLVEILFLRSLLTVCMLQVSSEMATDRIDRGGEETEEEPLVNGFTDLSMREKDEDQQREDGESAREVVEMFTQKTGQYFSFLLFKRHHPIRI